MSNHNRKAKNNYPTSCAGDITHALGTPSLGREVMFLQIIQKDQYLGFQKQSFPLIIIHHLPTNVTSIILGKYNKNKMEMA